MKIKSGDQVVVLVGRDKGRKGKIEKVFPKLKKVLVSGVNVYKRHKKPQGKTLQGGIIDITKPLPASNVALVCPKCNLPTKVGYKIEEKNKQSLRPGGLKQSLQPGGLKERICKKCKQIID